MEVFEIKPNGFCSGVIKAIKKIEDILNDESTPKPIYMLGHLVHNKKIVDYFKQKIIVITDDFESFLTKTNQGTIIFTAHGISPKIKEIATLKENNNFLVVDTTCVNVSKIHSIIKDYIRLYPNRSVLVIGKDNHPEVLGFLGISLNVKMYKENESISDYSLIVNQTTISYDYVVETFNKIKAINPTVILSEEICYATKQRQFSIVENVHKYDCFIIIGDKLSNNCRSLYEIVLNNGKPCFQIEDVSDLNDIDLSIYNTIGVSAGASTPRTIINEVVMNLKNYSKNKIYKTNLKLKDYIKIKEF